MAKKKFCWNYDEPLERAKGESAAANRALQDYCQMGVRRSLAKLHKKYTERNTDDEQTEKPPTRVRSTMNGWSFLFAWVDRSIRFDELEADRRIEIWRERTLKLQEDDYSLGEKMRELANQIVDAGPNFIKRKSKTLPDGTEIITVALSIQDLRSMADLGSKLQRLAAGEVTDRIKVTSWQDDIVALLKRGEIEPADLDGVVDNETITQLVAAAGVDYAGAS